MASATVPPTYTVPITKFTGDQAPPNPGTYSLNPNIRSQIDVLRNMWAMRFNTPAGTSTNIANMPYGRWQFGNVQAPQGAPAGWGQHATGQAGIPGVYGFNAGNIAQPVSNTVVDGVPTGLLNQQTGKPNPVPAPGTPGGLPLPSVPQTPVVPPQQQTPPQQQGGPGPDANGFYNAAALNGLGLLGQQQPGPMPGTPEWWQLQQQQHISGG